MDGIQEVRKVDPRVRQADRDGLAKLPEAAEFLGCTVAALRKWMAQGRLERVKVGRLTRVRWRDLVSIMANGLPHRL
jgi:excisionase family DNA binding protein